MYRITYIRKLLKLTVVLFLIVLGVERTAAQTGIAFSWYLINDNNAFKSRTKYEELINSASLNLSRAYIKGNTVFQAFYGADMSIFSESTDQENLAHQIGILTRSQSGNFKTDAGFFTQFRRNEAQYIYYNTNTYTFYIKTQYEPSLDKVLTLGLNHYKNEYLEFEDLDNATYRVYGKYQQFFRSRLSVSGEIGLNVRNYVNQVKYASFGVFSGPVGMFPRLKEDPVNVMQFSTDLNFGKSLSNNTGINLGLGGTRYIGEPIHSYSEGIYYYTENDLYDDPYSYADYYASLNLTRQFNVGFQGKLGILYRSKDYSGTIALDSEGDLTDNIRHDYRTEYSFQLTKKIERDWMSGFKLNMNFRFLIRENKSNDPYFQFTDHLGIFGFSISR